MRNKYLIGYVESQFEEKEFCIVVATNPEEAIGKFIEEIAVSDDLFSDHVRDRSVNMSFASHFWMQTEEEQSEFDRTGKIIINKIDFEKRVHKFFGEHNDYADLFIKSYFANDDSQNDDDPRINVDFPKKMLVYIWLHSSYADIKAFHLDEIKEIES
ncbi:hypothetical protein [Giesbergeria anulus]|uniref:Uncharacterized protein n=1 Tax=Giesbergeria anulus TaxID=180197 RepID=A0A1H9MGV0_9BURK|nr:hypothetical protein [Giesbergeria anulus]SER22655.1 hypothetical protein SAMN02982919_01998 [Giesbergeria anulus]